MLCYVIYNGEMQNKAPDNGHVNTGCHETPHRPTACIAHTAPKYMLGF